MSALMDWMVTVLGMMSWVGPLRSLGGYSDVLKSVLTSVDLPRPDSPWEEVSAGVDGGAQADRAYRRP